MPHEFQFCDSVLPEPVTVLGLKLKNYSIGHNLLLLRQRNHLFVLSGGQFAVCAPETQVAAIQNAVLVCSRTWEENQRKEALPPAIWKWQQRKADYGQAILDFLKYRADGSKFPAPPTKEAKAALSKDGKEDPSGRLLGAPFLCRLYAYAITLPERELRAFGPTAFDVPLGFATFVYLTHLENEGAFQIENEAEADVRMQYEKILAEIPAERRMG